MEPIIAEFRDKLDKYQLENIFNMDETGLLYRALPTRTYVSRSEGDRQNIRGTKALKAKDRATLVLCTNVTGTCKIEPLLVGSSKQPHCFRDTPCPIPYTCQSNAWVDRTVYRFWWSNVFLPEVRRFTSDPVALLMDNCAGHDPNCIDPTGQVDVYFFPPNVTSVYQPLDQGIIASVKAVYKREMVGRLVEAYGKYDELQEVASRAKKGRKGLQFGCPATILDAAQIIQKSWKNLSLDTIVRCWKRANCLPHSLEELVSSSNARKPTAPHESAPARSVCDILSTISNMPRNQEHLESIGLTDVVEILKKSDEEELVNLVERWLDLEEDPEIIAAQDLHLAQSIDNEFDASAVDSSTCSQQQSMSESMSDSLPHAPMEVDEDLGVAAKEAFLKSALAIIEMNINDPVLLAAAQIVKNHCMKSYSRLCFNFL